MMVCSGPGARQLQNVLGMAKGLDEVQQANALMQRYFLDRTKPHIPLQPFGQH